jgi:hypothetical protein
VIRVDYFTHGRIIGPFPPQFFGPKTPSEQSQVTVLPYDDPRTRRDLDYEDTPPIPSPSPQPTVIPYAPSPPYANSLSQSASSPEIYGPDRLFGPPIIPPPTYNSHAPLTFASNSIVRFDEDQLAMDAAAAAMRVKTIRDELTIAAGQVTPGVDDTPYIQYALEALTRDDASGFSRNLPSGDSFSSFENGRQLYNPESSLLPSLLPPMPPVPPPVRSAFYTPHIRTQLVTTPELGDMPSNMMTGHVTLLPPPTTLDDRPHEWRLAAFDSQTPSLHSSDFNGESNKEKRKPWSKTSWRPFEQTKLDRLPPNQKRWLPTLNYVPQILRLLPMICFMILCLLMITLLMLSAIYSIRRSGLIEYAGTMYHGQYFLFRIFPQMLAAAILLYAQCLMTATYRILPFSMMTHAEPASRYEALFQDLYPKSFLWPVLVGPWQIKTCIFVFWLANFTLPLQSALFSVIFVDGTWKWAAVQGAAWLLVVYYFALLGTAIMLTIFWHNRTTGLLWDVTSIADILPMINRSNTLEDFIGTEVLGKRLDLKSALRNRMVDRLGYWQAEDLTAGIWYAIGAQDDQVGMPPHEIYEKTGKKLQNMPSISIERLDESGQNDQVRYGFLPWCLRSNQLLYFVVGGFVLLLALFVVSFLPNTRISRGFLPGLPAGPHDGAFSSANFLYGFIPALIGQMIFLLFQGLEFSLRVLQPWAELAQPEGTLAANSILADYATCLPGEVTFKAVKNKHFRLAAITLISSLAIFIPILSGGLFMALSLEEVDEVRMFPIMPVFGIVLGLLCLLLAGLVIMLPGRKQYRLPHGVTCLAEIISFCANEDTARDQSFRFPRSKIDMLTRLGVGRDAHEQTRWYFGIAPGRDEKLGVRRLKRFTERKIIP